MEERKFKKWGWKALLALLGLAAAGAFGFFSIFNTVRVAAAEPALSENEANEAASVTITDAELEQLLSGELTLDSLTRTGTDEAPAASEAQGIAAGEQPARTESEASSSSEPEDSASGTEQSAASSSKAPVEEKQQEAACEAEVKALIQQTYALKAIAEKGLNSSISAAKAEYKTLPAEQQTKTKKIMICLSKTGELTSLQSYCDKEMGRIMDLMLKRMEAVRENIETTVGDHNTKQVSRSDSTTVLTWLRDSQQDTRDNMTGLQNNLTDLQNKHELLEKSIETADQDLAAQEKPAEPKQSGAKKFVLIGFLLGIVAVAGVAVVRFLMEDKVCVSEDLQSSCGVGVLGTLANAASKSAKGMDASLNKMEKRPDGSADAEMTRLIAATIRNRVPEAENILLTGDIAGDQLTALGEALKASGELDGKNILVSGSILQSSATVSEAAKVDVVVLAADCAVSTHASLRAQKAKLESFGKKVLGCVLYA